MHGNVRLGSIWQRVEKSVVLLGTAGALAIVTGCGGGSGGGGGTTLSNPTVTSVSASCSQTSISTNQTSTCSATVTGTGSYSSAVTWSVSPSSIGTVSSAGVFTPAAAGTATITATSTQDSTKSGSVTVTVTAASTIASVTVACLPASIQTNQTSACTATVTGAGSPSQTVTWSVSPASMGTVSSTGVFTPSGAGTANITATSTQDTTKSGTVAVAVAAAVVYGSLSVSVIDLPSGANAAITLSGPNGYSTAINGSQTLQNLALGTYTLAASKVHYGNFTYLPTTATVSVDITGSTPAASSIDYYNVQPDTTKVLDSVGLASLVLGADGSTLIINGQSTVAQSLSPGDILIISSTTAIPSGKVVKVNAVSVSAGWYIVMNSPATLMDAYQQYQMSISLQLDSSAIASQSAVATGVRVFRVPKPEVSDVSDSSTSDPCANQSVVYAKPVDTPLSDDPKSILNDVTISGTIKFCPSIKASLDWSLRSNKEAHFEVDLGESADITATLSVSESLPKTEVKLFDASYPTFFVGIIPVSPTVTFYAGAKGSASASLSMEALQSATVQAGFDYVNGTVTPIKGFSANVSSAAQPQFHGTANLESYVRAEFAADIAFGTMNPYVSVSPYISANVDITGNPWWSIDYGIDGEVGIGGLVGDAAQQLGFDPTWSAAILGPNPIIEASGAFQATPASITGVNPMPVVGSSKTQQISLNGTSLASVKKVILCSTTCLSPITPDSVTATVVNLTTVLLPGSWTAMTQDTYGNSNIYPFTVYPPPTNVVLQTVSPTQPQISAKSQQVSFTGSGMEPDAQLVVCFRNVCNAPVTSTVSADGTTASISTLLDHAGLWTAVLTNTNGSHSATFSFNVSGPLSATVAPTGGIVNTTEFKAKGSGATPGKVVILTVTPPSGSAQTTNLTADQNGAFQSSSFSESSAGAYTLVFTDQTTGTASNSSTILLSNGINAQVYPGSAALNSTSFTVSGWGANPGATVLIAVAAPGNQSLSATTIANSSGNFTFTSFPANTVGTFNAICEDLSSTTKSPMLTWTVSAASAIQAAVSPQSGVADTTAFTISGKGASGSGGVTASVTTQNGALVYHTLASSGGTFSFASIKETVAGNYTATVSDDKTGSQTPIFGWTVNPDANTQLQTMTVTPASWSPVFATGATAVAVMPMVIAGGGTNALTGTITSNQTWLLVDGHSSESWTAPESIALNVNPSGLSAGSHSATLTISSSGASNHQITVPVTATIRQPLQVTTTSIPDILGGNPYSTQLSAVGGAGSGYKWSLVSGYLPYGVSLDANSGVISGTATLASSTQSLQFSVQVEDSSGADATAWITVTYRPGLFVLIYSPSSFQFTVGSLYTTTNSIVIPTQGGIAPITLTAVGMPPGLALNSTTGLITGTPTKAGNYSVIFYAQDASGDKGNATFTLQVVMIPLKISTSTLPSAQVGAPYQQYITGSGGSQAGYAWSIQGNLPAGLQSTANTSCAQCALQISGTPTVAGSYPITVTLTDSLNNTVSQSITLVVASAQPPQLPAAILPLATIGAPFTYSFSASGGTPPYSWSFSGSGPDPGLQLSTSGVLSGTPTVASACPSGNSSTWYGATGVPAITFQVRVTDANSQYAIQQFCMGTYYPTPVVAAVTPSPIVADGQSHVLTVSGAYFRSTSYVNVAGVSLSTHYVDAQHLTMTLLPSTNGLFAINMANNAQDSFGAQTAVVTVIQPDANASNQNQGFTIANPPPTITSISAVLNNSSSPCKANYLCQLVISGSGLVFDSQYQIQNQSTVLQRSSWPSSNLPWNTVTTSSFWVSSAGTYSVVISNPNQAGGGTATAQGQFSVVQ